MLMSDSPICLWPQCNELFMCVEDLIQHVEEEHVMSDKKSSIDTAFDLQRLDSGLELVLSPIGLDAAVSINAASNANATTFAHTASLPTCFTQSMELCGTNSNVGNSYSNLSTGYVTARSVDLDSPVSRFIHMSHVSPYFTDEERAVRRKQQELCRRRPIGTHDSLLLDDDFADMDLDLPLRKRRKSSGVDSAYGYDLIDTQLGSRSFSPADSAIGSPICEVPVKTSQFAHSSTKSTDASTAVVPTSGLPACSCTPTATCATTTTSATVCEYASTATSTCSSTCPSRSSTPIYSAHEDSASKESSTQPVVKKLDTFSREIIAASSAQIDPSEKRPYRCPVPLCDKQYKNLNGIKYHSQHGHTNLGPEQQVYQCHLQTESNPINTRCNHTVRSSASMKEHVKKDHPAFVERVGRERNPRPSVSKASTQAQKATLPSAQKAALTQTQTQGQTATPAHVVHALA
ncbi:hypothetical protein SARC_03718 [Sphaeroforma arctica JP610]|uniref:C2H2-type domain-containing protein n=1 Tax=Sphaeroforma arctica JP610 TaxID=667725 RepID=A0A0L0G5G4_9EUKA|nr:hypothetical protein SARC_03718 [Sphaeroforma arctica JP610]KNC84056.1 hypothetical protein SARC_03718 [Sphaeroforma arctica JP610]|eukprot:XP_014157958.1 hypothetical protein SARC_03718 [Sphaeroforma arctica JP610]